MKPFWRVWVAWGGNGWFMRVPAGEPVECASFEEAMGRADAYRQANPDARVNVCGPFTHPPAPKETETDGRDETRTGTDDTAT